MSYKSKYSDFIVDNLVKYKCNNKRCGNEFILSEYEDKQQKDKGRFISCPYCSGRDVKSTAHLENDELLSSLNGITIGHIECEEVTERDIKKMMKHDSYKRHRGAVMQK